jgi:hypothetical protein
MTAPILPVMPLLTLDAPSFDVDENVAAQVLEHVENPLDRFALAGVSRVWRRAVEATLVTTATSSSSCERPKQGATRHVCAAQSLLISQ